MEETIARYQTEIEELQKSRKEILQKAKEEAEQLMQEANARIENTIRAIKEAQAEKEKTRQIRQELNDFRESLDTLTAKETATDTAALAHGDCKHVFRPVPGECSSSARNDLPDT